MYVSYEDFGCDHLDNKYLRVFWVVRLYPLEVRQQWTCLQVTIDCGKRLHVWTQKHKIVKGTSPQMV